MPQVCFSTISKTLFGSLVLPKISKLSLKSTTSKVSVRNFQMDNGHSDSSRGALVVLEGLDRSGKTSQSNRLVEFLEGLGISTELWRFPDRTTCVGEMISSYLVNKSQMDDRTIHLLFSANRWEKRSLMESKLRNGTTLIVDRYSYSGVAFSSAKGLDIEWCKAPEIGLLAPDLVVYLDIPPEKAAARGGYGGERYEQLEFQKKVSQHYQILHDATWKIIDACLPMEEIEKQLRELVLDSVTACKNGKPLSSLWLRSCNNCMCSTLPEKLEVSNPGLMRNPTDLNDAINACNDKSLHRFPASRVDKERRLISLQMADIIPHSATFSIK